MHERQSLPTGWIHSGRFPSAQDLSGALKCNLVTALIVLKVAGNPQEEADKNTRQLRLWQSLIWMSEVCWLSGL